LLLRRVMSRASLVVAAVCALVVAAPAAAYAAYYNTYTTVATLGNAESCTADEGFAVGSTYTYSVKINSAEDKAIIYRTKMSDGTVTLMSNGDTGTDYATYLGHANDVALMSNGGDYYMYVVTMNAGSTSLVKLQYIGTTYYKVGSYTITSGGTDVAMSGVKIVQKDSSYVYFLLKSGKSFYRGKLGLTATSGSIPVSSAFTVDIANAQVNGSTVSNIDSFATQGIGYYDGSLYFALTLDNVSIVLVYDGILDIYNNGSPTSPPVIEADSNLSFRITSAAYPYKFEIEGVGFASGVMWFSANRQTESSDLSHDGVFYFNDYVAS
jgi:hypothetical protein